ncbi:MAG: hypothetical protein GX621_13455, partial [Pirellulaceae bacterium]|nr:hypothetical protein [Pirellulaceae bacterium]
WKRRSGDRDLAEATEDIPALLAAAQKASFCHGQGWFTLPWIFGKNKNGELNAPRLLAGAFAQNGTGKPKTPIGAGQRHPTDYPTQEGQF